MAKRFTDTGKWDQAWFRKLNPKMKCVWSFLCDRCDHAGVWEVDIESMSFFVGEPVLLVEILRDFANQIRVVSETKIVIQAFIDFQYGHLNPDNRVHKSVISRLDKLQKKPLASPLLGAKDKDYYKDKDKDKDKEAEIFQITSRENQPREVSEIKEIKQHWFEGFVVNELNSMDFGLTILSSKIDKAFGSEAGFREWLGGVTKTEKFKKIGPDEQIRYFKKSLAAEMNFRGVS